MFSSSQKKLIAHFENAVKYDTLRQCYIIKGERGLGKKTAVEKIKEYIMCQSGTACGKCNNCQTLISGANPDCKTVSNGEKQTIEVAKLRAMIKDVYVKPVSCKYRLFVIENAHLMDSSGQNAILKVIEEPPSYAVFIFICDNLNAILPTIISRSHILDLEKWSVEDLKAACPLGAEDEYMYSYCLGNIGMLKAVSEDEDFADLRNGVIKSFVPVVTQGNLALYDAIDFWLANKEHKDKLTEILIMFLRDVMLYKSSLPNLLANTDKLNEIQAVSSAVSLKKSFDMLKIANDAPRMLGKYGNFSIAAQTLLMQLKKE